MEAEVKDNNKKKEEEKIKGKAGNQGLGLEERLEQGWGHFHHRGYKVILF